MNYTEKVILRKLKISDASFMREFYEDSAISQQFKYTQENYKEDLAIKFIRSSWHLKDSYHYAIECNGVYAGTISLKNVNPLCNHAEYSIVVRKTFWGRNIAYIASKMILDIGFNNLNLNKIYLNVLSSNERAQKLYKKLGFISEGFFKQHLFINNQYRDLCWYAIFSENYKIQQGE